MKLFRLSIVFTVLSLAAVAQQATVVIRAGTLLDGKGLDTSCAVGLARLVRE